MPGCLLSEIVSLYFIIHMEPGPRRVSGRAQDITRGGAGHRVMQQSVENPECFWQISRDAVFGQAYFLLLDHTCGST